MHLGLYHLKAKFSCNVAWICIFFIMCIVALVSCSNYLSIRIYRLWPEGIIQYFCVPMVDDLNKCPPFRSEHWMLFCDNRLQNKWKDSTIGDSYSIWGYEEAVSIFKSFSANHNISGTFLELFSSIIFSYDL